MKTKLFLLVALLLMVTAAQAWAVDGLIALKSPYGPKETMDRLQNILVQKKMTIFARIDHAAGAAKIGQTLRPTEVLIFGNPKGGTPFMVCAQTAGIDLPLKALVWQDASGQVWLGYNDLDLLARRHGATQCPVIAKLTKVLDEISRQAVAK